VGWDLFSVQRDNSLLTDALDLERVELATALMDAGADLLGKSVDGGTAVHAAASICAENLLVRIIGEVPADALVARDRFDASPLVYAARGRPAEGRAPTLALLVDAGAKIPRSQLNVRTLRSQTVMAARQRSTSA